VKQQHYVDIRLEWSENMQKVELQDSC